MHAMCLDLLDSHLVEGASVLDVGSGSGYLTAAMAYMVRPGGLAVGVEHVPQLADWSIENIKMANPELIKEGVVQIVSADGRKGVPEKAPFDVIHVGAASLGKPTELMKQLKVGGRMVVPVERTRGDQLLMTIDRVGEDQFQEHVITSVRYVPLTDKKKQLTGQTDYY